MKKVLMISSRGYLPEIQAGSLRMHKFSKYLIEKDWKPIIVSPPINKAKTLDYNILEEKPKEVNIRRVGFRFNFTRGRGKIKDFLRILFVLEYELLWGIYSLNEIRNIFHETKPDLIFSSSPPNTNHILAYLLKQQFNTPWIADFRDLWIENPNYDAHTPVHEYYEKKIEEKILKKTDSIIQVTPDAKKKFLNRFPQFSKKTNYIPNGFDPDDFKKEINKSNDKMILTYGGRFFENYSSTFLDSLSLLIKENPQIKDDIKLVFFPIHHKHKKKIKELGLEDITEIKGPIQYTKAMDIISHSDVYILTTCQKESYTITYPSRLFNYIGGDGYILGIVPKHFALTRLITKTESGCVINPEEIEGIKEKLKELWEKWKKDGKIIIERNEKESKKYLRDNQARKLAKVFNNTK